MAKFQSLRCYCEKVEPGPREGYPIHDQAARGRRCKCYLKTMGKRGAREIILYEVEVEE